MVQYIFIVKFVLHLLSDLHGFNFIRMHILAYAQPGTISLGEFNRFYFRFLRTFTCETMVLLSFCTKLFFTLRTPFESAFFSARFEANLLSKVYLHYGTLHVMPVLYFPCKSTNTCFV